MSDVRELLPLYALGVLDPTEVREVERAVATDPALAAELAAYRQATDALIDAVVPVAPSAEVKARILTSIGSGRFEKFSARVASLFDVTVDRARELLGFVERKASWENPVPGIGLVHFSGGPACATADCGFIRIAAGATFPWHKHRGEEVTLVLAGVLRERGGLVLHPGDEMVFAVGTQHDLTAEGDVDVIFVARAEGGIEVGPPS